MANGPFEYIPSTMIDNYKRSTGEFWVIYLGDLPEGSYAGFWPKYNDANEDSQANSVRFQLSWPAQVIGREFLAWAREYNPMYKLAVIAGLFP